MVDGVVVVGFFRDLVLWLSYCILVGMVELLDCCDLYLVQFKDMVILLGGIIIVGVCVLECIGLCFVLIEVVVVVVECS